MPGLENQGVQRTLREVISKRSREHHRCEGGANTSDTPICARCIWHSHDLPFVSTRVSRYAYNQICRPKAVLPQIGHGSQ